MIADGDGSPPPEPWLGAATVAAATWLGAATAVALPLPVVAAAVVAAVGWRRVGVVAVAALLVAGTLGARAEAGLDPAPAGPWSGWATLRSDAEPAGAALRFDAEVDGRRLEVWARGAAATALAPRLLGERVELAGRVRPATADDAWAARRHVVGRLEVHRVGAHADADPVHGAANRLRRLLAEGAEPLGDDRRALFLGLVIGDDRGHDALVVDDFLGSGLTHLMAVSGANVAFVLLLVGPLLRRLRPAPRLVAVLVAVAGFALVTRFEPSVLRASAMAGAAAIAAALGRPTTGRRALAVAVTAVVLVDPFLVGSVGFRLSVAASAGILLLAAPLARRLPGPRPLATAVAVTAAAQLAVSPLLVATFGGVPVASLPANVVAAPLAGPVMVWGLPAGLVAGLAGPPVDAWLHAPTGVLVGAVATVARWGATLPLGDLGGVHVVAVTAGAALAAVGSARGRRGAPAVAGTAMVAVALAAPAVALAVGSGGAVVAVAPGADLHRAGGARVLVLDGTADAGDVLAGLRRRGVHRLHLIVCRSGGARVAEVVALVDRRLAVDAVVAPPRHRVPRAVTAPGDAELVVGGLRVRLDVTGRSLAVVVTPVAVSRAAPGGGARGPPV